MSISQRKDKVIFAATLEDLQQKAMSHIGRKLTEEELDDVVKGVGSGLSCDVETVLKTAIDEAVV